jgi:hypothetical protein
MSNLDDKRKKILDYFRLLKKKDVLGTSYLFVGNDFSLIKDIVKLLSCRQLEFSCDSCWDCRQIQANSHPDVFTVEPDNGMIKIEPIREIQKSLYLRSFCLKRKILLINDGEFTLEAGNAFLKTLEEPPKNSLIFICTSSLDKLLPTIISRCRRISLPVIEENNKAYSFSKVQDFLSGNRPKFKDRQEFGDFLWLLALLLRDCLVSRLGVNIKLLNNHDCEIILNRYNWQKAEEILTELLTIYRAHNTVNENLALNLIKMKL